MSMQQLQYKVLLHFLEWFLLFFLLHLLHMIVGLPEPEEWWWREKTVDYWEISVRSSATLMSRRLMSCWSAERKPWLILGKTIWAGVRDQEVGGGRGWRRDSLMKSQKKEKVEEIKKHKNRLDQVVETEDQVQCLQAWGEIHTFLQWWFLKSIFEDYIWPQRFHLLPQGCWDTHLEFISLEKNVNFFSLNALSSQKCLVLSQTPGAAHSEVMVLVSHHLKKCTTFTSIEKYTGRRDLW